MPSVTLTRLCILIIGVVVRSRYYPHWAMELITIQFPCNASYMVLLNRSIAALVVLGEPHQPESPSCSFHFSFAPPRFSV